MYFCLFRSVRHISSATAYVLSFRRKMSSLAKCRLVCASGSHRPIDLPHKESVTIGRSVQTKIADKKVSRQQVSVEADCKARSVTVTQLGGNPCQVGDRELEKGASTTLRGDTVLYLVAGLYPHRVEFEGGKQDGGTRRAEDGEQKRSISDFFGKKTTENNKVKRRAEEEAAEGQRKRQRTDSERGASPDQSNDNEEIDEEEEERLRLVQERLSKMKKTYDQEPKSENNGASKKSVPEAQGAPSSTAKWEKHEKLIIYTEAGVRAAHKVAAFDIDGCIICTKSGKVFAQNAADWKIQFPEIKKKLKRLLSDGYKVAFFTNQMGIARGKVKEADFKQKVEGIVSQLDLPIQVFIASGPGVYRKPSLGMWNFLIHHRNEGIEVDVNQSFYVGDAAGRPEKWAPGKKKDFAMSDRLFALNADLVFHTPEEFFLGYKKAPFNMPEFDPRKLPTDLPMFASDSAKLKSGGQEVIVNVGLPGSGKSHFSRSHLLPKGYVHVNRDTLGSWQKCVEATKRSLKEGRSVVVDNTNVDPDSRKRYTDVAKTANVTCRCFWFDVSPKQCRHNERFREMTDKSHQAINDMIFNQHKSKFKAPERSEGFAEVVKVNFVPSFKDMTEEKLYRQFLLEK